MTLSMGIALGIVILMIVMIMSDKFAFGGPPLLACALMVLFGVSTVSEAFQGFVDSNVVMIAGFMAVMGALQKTHFMGKIQGMMAKLASKGGFLAYAAMILVAMIGASFMSGSTGYYVMILTILSTIPYNKKLPNSKLMMPVAFATGRAIIPVSVAFFMGLAGSLLESGGVTGTIEMGRFSLMVAIMSLFYLAWALIAYKILPDFDIHEGNSETVEKAEEVKVTLAPWQEYIVYAAFAISVIGMMFASSIGEIAYILPGVCTGILCLCKVFDFKEARNQLFSPLIIMMAAVIGVANGLASTGFTAMVGEAVAKALGGNVNGFVLILMFCLLTSASATLTGASIGSVFVFAPIGIATCQSLGINPIPLAAAVVVSGWGGGFLPIDGLPAMILGMGKYKLKQFLAYSVPMYLIQILGLAVGAVIAFGL
ncbi:MAG: SLC13 family permease [Faecousia sp.]